MTEFRIVQVVIGGGITITSIALAVSYAILSTLLGVEVEWKEREDDLQDDSHEG